jgi:hypothetical protein
MCHQDSRLIRPAGTTGKTQKTNLSIPGIQQKETVKKSFKMPEKIAHQHSSRKVKKKRKPATSELSSSWPRIPRSSVEFDAFVPGRSGVLASTGHERA